MSDIKQQLSDAASKEIAGVKSRVYGQVANVEAKVKGKFQTFLSNHPKKLIALALILGFVTGLFFGAVAGVKIARVDVQSVQAESGLTAEDVGVSPVSTTEGWHEFVPQFRPAWGNG